MQPSISEAFDNLFGPELVTASYVNPALEFEGGTFRITTPQGGFGMVALTARDYKIEKKNRDGSWEQMKRVQSFTFHVDIETPALITLKYLDFEDNV